MAPAVTGRRGGATGRSGAARWLCGLSAFGWDRLLGLDALYTASTFVAYYAQRIMSACVLNGARARGVFKVLGKARRR